jgi:hypothetical protein
MNEDWALIVGIDRYHPTAGVDPLGGAVGDAIRFRDWVMKPDGGGITDETHVKLLISPDPQDHRRPRPAFYHIHQFFSELSTDTGDTSAPGRRLYVFLSGHGISPAGAESVRNAALLMADTTRNRISSFPGNVWAEGARSTNLFQEVVLIMDCCRDLQKRARVAPHPFEPPTCDSREAILLEAYSTQWASKSREDKFPPDECKQGIFSHSVLEVLKSGRIDGAVFKESVLANVAITLKSCGVSQEPEIKGNPSDEVLGRIVFNERAASPRTPIRVCNASAAPAVFRMRKGGGTLIPVPDVHWLPGDGVWTTEMPPDNYQLRWHDHPAWDHVLPVFAAVPVEIRVPQ